MVSYNGLLYLYSTPVCSPVCAWMLYKCVCLCGCGCVYVALCVCMVLCVFGVWIGCSVVACYKDLLSLCGMGREWYTGNFCQRMPVDARPCLCVYCGVYARIRVNVCSLSVRVCQRYVFCIFLYWCVCYPVNLYVSVCGVVDCFVFVCSSYMSPLISLVTSHPPAHRYSRVCVKVRVCVNVCDLVVNVCDLVVNVCDLVVNVCDLVVNTTNRLPNICYL
eukprot:GHVQ01025794.1.p1 GENE.GHVQ01025794.1~~GHVQ01025794.1.p1  ORF type:complete len:219 (+),score=23.68 GHVQ01025794.1:1331-1987(+)